MADCARSMALLSLCSTATRSVRSLHVRYATMELPWSCSSSTDESAAQTES